MPRAAIMMLRTPEHAGHGADDALAGEVRRRYPSVVRRLAQESPK
jgi:hypothetical protein